MCVQIIGIPTPTWTCVEIWGLCNLWVPDLAVSKPTWTTAEKTTWFLPRPFWRTGAASFQICFYTWEVMKYLGTVGTTAKIWHGWFFGNDGGFAVGYLILAKSSLGVCRDETRWTAYGNCVWPLSRKQHQAFEILDLMCYHVGLEQLCKVWLANCFKEDDGLLQLQWRPGLSRISNQNGWLGMHIDTMWREVWWDLVRSSTTLSTAWQTSAANWIGRQFFGMYLGWNLKWTFLCWQVSRVLPTTNIAPENRPFQKETSLPTIYFQV